MHIAHRVKVKGEHVINYATITQDRHKFSNYHISHIFFEWCGVLVEMEREREKQIADKLRILLQHLRLTLRA